MHDYDVVVRIFHREIDGLGNPKASAMERVYRVAAADRLAAKANAIRDNWNELHSGYGMAVISIQQV